MLGSSVRGGLATQKGEDGEDRRREKRNTIGIVTPQIPLFVTVCSELPASGRAKTDYFGLAVVHT